MKLLEMLSSLEENKRSVVAQMIQDLSKLQGVEAIVLGGSHARAAARPDSDVDLGLYYTEKSR